jgi:hypothetical protein
MSINAAEVLSCPTPPTCLINSFTFPKWRKLGTGPKTGRECAVQLQLLEPIVSPRVAFCGSKSCWIFWRGFHPLRALRRGRHGLVFLIKLFPDRRQLPAFEIADFDRAPSFGSADQRTEHHFRDRAFTEGIGNDLEAPPLHR